MEKNLPLLIADWLICYCGCNAFHLHHYLMSTCMLYFTCTCMLVVSINDATCNYMYSMFFSMGVTELPQILLQRALYMYEEDPINFRKCTIWWDPPWKKFFFSFSSNTECNVSKVMTQKSILCLWAKLVRHHKMFGNGDSFPNTAETPLQRDFRALIFYYYCQGKPF